MTSGVIRHIPLLAGLLAAIAGRSLFEGLDLRILLVALGLVSVGVLAWGYQRRDRSLPVFVDGRYVTLVLSVVRYAGGAILICVWEELFQGSDRWRGYYQQWADDSVLSTVVFMSATGILALFSGLYAWGNSKPDRGAPADWLELERYRRGATPLVAMVGVMAIVERALPVELRYMATTVVSAGNPLLILTLASGFASRGRSARIGWYALAAASAIPAAAASAVSGMREGLLKLPLSVLAGYSIGKRRFPVFAAAAGLCAMVVVFLPYLNERKREMSGLGNPNPGLPAVEEGRFSGATIGDTVATALVRLNGAVFLAAYSTHYDSMYPFEYGRSMLLEIQGMVPRIVWPTKPEISAELGSYPRRVGLILYEDDSTTATFDWISEYYLNFGFPGIVILGYLHGLYLGTLRRELQRRIGKGIGVVLFFSLVMMDHDQFGLVLLIVSHSRMLAVWYLLFRLFLRGRRAARPPYGMAGGGEMAGVSGGLEAWRRGA